jgi:hypothetical protein
VKGRLGGGNAAGAGLGAGGAGPLFDGGHGTGDKLPPNPIGPLLSGTPVVGNVVSTGFRGTTAADVEAVVDPPSDAWSAHMVVFFYFINLFLFSLHNTFTHKHT